MARPGATSTIGLVLGIGYAASWVFLLAGAGVFDPMGRPVGTDFALFYGVSRAVLRGVAPELLYAPQVLNDAIRDVTGGAEYVWMYPPTALIMCWPLATLPYFGALVLWTGVGILAYLSVTSRVLPTRAALVGAILSPAVYCCVVNGHNGLDDRGFGRCGCRPAAHATRCGGRSSVPPRCSSRTWCCLSRLRCSHPVGG